MVVLAQPRSGQPISPGGVSRDDHWDSIQFQDRSQIEYLERIAGLPALESFPKNLDFETVSAARGPFSHFILY